MTFPPTARCWSALLIAFLLVQGHASATAESADVSFPSPNQRYALRLRTGNAIGNAFYDRAEIVDQKRHRVLRELPRDSADSNVSPAGGFGWFDDPPAFWSPDSRYVAVVHHDHRTGEIQVARCIRGRALLCKIPTIIVPRLESAFEEGSQWQTLLKPERWTRDGELIAHYSGTIRHYEKAPARPGREAELCYEYRIGLRFSAGGMGKVTFIHRLAWKNVYVP